MKKQVFGISVQEAIEYEPQTTPPPSLCSAIAGGNGVEVEWETGEQRKFRSSLLLITTS